MMHIAKWKVSLILGICALGLLFVSPNFLSKDSASSLPSWYPNQQINLGLDLQGGSHLLLEVETDAVITERLEALVDSARAELRKARIRYAGLKVEGLSAVVSIKDLDRADEARDLLRKLDTDTDTEIGDNGRITMALTEVAVKARRIAAVEQSIEIVRRRIDSSGVNEPVIQRQGDQRILVQLPGLDDPERIKRLLGKTAKMSFHLVDSAADVNAAMAGRVPPGSMVMPSANEINTNGQPRLYVLKKRVMVSGDTLIDASPSFGQNNEPVVSFRFDSIGAKRFADTTKKNTGKLFAIVLDSKVISAPVIREPILGGQGQISGSFTVQSANDLAVLLRAGALPAPLTILEERTVGPGLGADSIAAGKIASIIGLIAVIIFMVIAYGRFGVMADVALLFNMVLIGGALSGLQATLTLPGIAGIVLTIGMAVDANVLIFERIREELRNGRTPISAVEAGYSRAIRTIIDANVTTLIAAVLLYEFGTGPIRGFAVTLAIGIITSMFTSIWLTRLMVTEWLRRTRPSTLEV